MKFLSILVPFLLFNSCFGQLITTVYDINGPNEEYIFGTGIQVEAGVLDQPNEIFLFDSTFIVKNTFGDKQIALFDFELNYLNSCLGKAAFGSLNLIYNKNKVYMLSLKRAKGFEFMDLIFCNSPLVTTYNIDDEVYWNTSLHSYKDGKSILFNPSTPEGARVLILDNEFKKIRSFGSISSNLIDTTLENNHLNSTITVDTKSDNLFIGYRYTNFIEKYDIETGKLVLLAHEENSQFPPSYTQMSGSKVTRAKTPYSFFTKMKVHNDKLYILYKYGVPDNPKKEDEKMRLIIFDSSNLQLLKTLILDEDLEDFVLVGKNELIGVCYYCEDPIRQYFIE